MNLVLALLSLALVTTACANSQEVGEAIPPNTAVYMMDHKGFQVPRGTNCWSSPTPLVSLVLAEHAIWLSVEPVSEALEEHERPDMVAETWRFSKIDSEHDWDAVRARLSSVRDALASQWPEKLDPIHPNSSFGGHDLVVVEVAAEDRIPYDQLLYAATLTQEAGFPRVSFVDIRDDTPSYLRE